MNAIRHVLFDADGVLQEPPGDWPGIAARWFGDRTEEFLRAAFADERPTLAGDGEFLPLLAARLVEFGIDAPVDEVFDDIWLSIVQSDESIRLVEAVRNAGFGVHIGTNQDVGRGSWMRRELGYDELFDVGCWSYEIGVAKPDPDYFIRAAQRIGADPVEILFIDDREDNVISARTVGMAGIAWHLSQGHDALVEQMAAVGVALP